MIRGRSYTAVSLAHCRTSDAPISASLPTRESHTVGEVLLGADRAGGTSQMCSAIPPDSILVLTS
jgi:hypothetical protein